MSKQIGYKLLGPDGKTYLSETPGVLGGNSQLKIYGRLDCWSANAGLRKGGYRNCRVFFADEATAIAAGYRPYGHCLREKYLAFLYCVTLRADRRRRDKDGWFSLVLMGHRRG